MRASQSGDRVDLSVPSSSVVPASSFFNRTPPLEWETHTSKPSTCYELQEQWLLVKQNYNAWQPRCVACLSDDSQKLIRVRETSVSSTQAGENSFSWLEGQFPAFEWHLIESPPGSYSRLTDTDTLTPCLILDQPGRYRVRFVVDPEASRHRDRQDTPAVPAIASELVITADESGIKPVAIALADFTVQSTALPSDSEPCLFLVAVYAGLTYL
ncbi:MAG TPA: hypothetical protein V6C63_00695 [Allocoleopsis sp.]